MNFGHRKSKPALGADQSSEAVKKEKVNKYRGVAQFGRVPALGAGCRRFKSCRLDHRLAVTERLLLFSDIYCNKYISDYSAKKL